MRKDAGRAAFLFAAVAGASTTLTAASAGAQERPYMKVGPWQILKIDDAGKFSRCTASMTTKAGMVRIHQMASGAWVVSIPRGDVPRGTTVAGGWSSADSPRRSRCWRTSSNERPFRSTEA
ncbi:MAG: hypothetical protein HZY79_11725 [Rhodoblastus sp.]|nr:MAG: hypothetical protein HZY79_11725 [Rhodoblastus sp.]